MYYGLIPYIQKFCDDRNYKIYYYPEVNLTNNFSMKEAEQFVYKKLSVGSLFIFQIRYISEDNFGNILTIREAESNGEMTVSLDPDQVSSLSQDEKDLIKYIYGIAF